MFCTFRCYSSLWRYAGTEELLSIITACEAAMIPCIVLHKIIGINYSLLFYILKAILIIVLTGGFRIAYRTARRILIISSTKEKTSRVLIIGGGHAGELVIREMKSNPQIGKKVVGIIDDDINKLGRRIRGVKILGTTDDIEDLLGREPIKTNLEEISDYLENIVRYL